MPDEPVFLEFKGDGTFSLPVENGDWMVRSGILCQFADKTWRAEIEGDGYAVSLVEENGIPWEKQRKTRILRPTNTDTREKDLSRSSRIRRRRR